MHTLLAIVEVPEEDRVLCQAPGCRKGVYRRIHVVSHDQKILVLGGDCYSRLYGAVSEREQGALWGAAGRLLTPVERAMLVSNTEALIRHFEQEALQQEAHRQQVERERLAGERRLQTEQHASAQGRQLDKKQERSSAWSSGAGNQPRPKNAWALRKELDRFRTENAQRAAEEAIERLPELGAYPLQQVAEAMVRAKAECLERGVDLDSVGSAQTIRFAALARLRAAR